MISRHLPAEMVVYCSPDLFLFDLVVIAPVHTCSCYETHSSVIGHLYSVKELNMARQRQSKHTKKQKETARKRGPSYLRKGVELGQKANIIAGGFYEEPTHHGWCLSCHIPEGRDLPDLQAIVRKYGYSSLYVFRRLTC